MSTSRWRHITTGDAFGAANRATRLAVRAAGQVVHLGDRRLWGARGRYPHRGAFGRWSSTDQQAVDEALAATGATNLADRLVDELSGGQRQRAWIAMVLAQQTPILLLDEPTTYLDPTTGTPLIIPLDPDHQTESSPAEVPSG